MKKLILIIIFSLIAMALAPFVNADEILLGSGQQSSQITNNIEVDLNLNVAWEIYIEFNGSGGYFNGLTLESMGDYDPLADTYANTQWTIKKDDTDLYSGDTSGFTLDYSDLGPGIIFPSWVEGSGDIYLNNDVLGDLYLKVTDLHGDKLPLQPRYTVEFMCELIALDSDLILPKIVLLGDETAYHPKGQIYHDEGAEVLEVDTGTPSNFSISVAGLNDLNTDETGVYEITYTTNGTDAAGNSPVPVTREVHVVDDPNNLLQDTESSDSVGGDGGGGGGGCFIRALPKK